MKYHVQRLYFHIVPHLFTARGSGWCTFCSGLNPPLSRLRAYRFLPPPPAGAEGASVGAVAGAREGVFGVVQSSSSTREQLVLFCSGRRYDVPSEAGKFSKSPSLTRLGR